MMKLRLVVVALVVAVVAACSGLLTAPGNDFPCDFSKPLGARDAVCSAGDVCGVDNRCQRFRYEGPQFEGLPTFPDFSAAVDAGTVIHPVLIRSRVDFVARVQGTEVVIAHSAEGYFRLDRGGPTPVTFPAPGPAQLTDVILLPRANPLMPPIVVGRETTNLVFHEGTASNRVRADGGFLRAQRLRSLELGASRTIGVIADPPTSLGAITTAGPIEQFVDFPSSLQMTEAHLDLVPGPFFTPPNNKTRTVVALSTDGLRARLPDGGIELVFPGVFPAQSLLAADVAATTFAVLSGRGQPTLSTFTVTRTGASFDVASPWSDCVPCAAPLAFTPGSDVGGPFVEVLCSLEGVKRVRGAMSSATGAACLTEDVGQRFDSKRVAIRPRQGVPLAVQDFASSAGFLGGGEDGQVWFGATISSALPYFLDRVPRDVAQVSLRDGNSGLFALTSVGAFAVTPGQGFVILQPDVTTRIEALVGEGQGWVVGAGGHMVQVAAEERARLSVRFGPRLVDGRGEGVAQPLRGEGIADADGGLISMVIAADDSLYFVPPRSAANADELGDVTAQLTPEPSNVIRSLALERTPIGTNGVDRVRGYVVTSRNVYEFNLGGAPLQWTAKPLPISGAEPVEVWFDNPRGGLARVGYRDGTIFSIPGGFQIAEALPGSDAGVPSAVIDYENLGGWPVALTTTGLFVARYDKRADNGRLDNRFPDGGVNKPMTWREVMLPDGSKPWMPKDALRDVRGKLHVVADPQTGTDRAYRRLFHLLVFTPTQVLEVGRHERTNISTPGGGVPPPATP
ncbi:MAG: hypothetical protein Q8L14_34660 [Myxococcales bacterium]|nr:hypothetical protein [Myxococcales bacterium]